MTELKGKKVFQTALNGKSRIIQLLLVLVLCSGAFAQDTKALNDDDMRNDILKFFGSQKPVVETLIEKLRSPDAKVRARAAWDLSGMVMSGEHGWQDTVKAYPILVKLLDDQNMEVVNGTLSALGQIAPLYYDKYGSVGSEKVLKKMASFLTNKDKDIRSGSILAIGSLDELAAPVVPEITKALGLDDFKKMKPEVRYQYLEERIFYFTALRDIGPNSVTAVPTLKEILKLKGIGKFDAFIRNIIVNILCAKALEYAQYNKYNEAIDCYKEALAFSSSPQIFLSRSIIWAKKSNLDKAIQDAETAIVTLKSSLSKLKEEKENPYEERKRFEDYQFNKSIYVEALSHLAQYYAQKADIKKAMEYLDTAIKEDYGNVRARTVLAAIHFKRQEWQKALDSLDILKQATPNDWNVFLLMGLAYEKLENDNEAVNSYLKVGKELNPNCIEAWQHLEKIYQKYKMEKDVKYCRERIEAISKK